MSVFQSPFWISFKRQKSFNVSSSCSTKQIYFNFSRSQSSVSRVSGSLESHLRSLLDELLNCKGKNFIFLIFLWIRAIFKRFFKYKPVEKAEGTSKASGSSVRYLSLGMFFYCKTTCKPLVFSRCSRPQTFLRRNARTKAVVKKAFLQANCRTNYQNSSLGSSYAITGNSRNLSCHQKALETHQLLDIWMYSAVCFITVFVCFFFFFAL